MLIGAAWLSLALLSATGASAAPYDPVAPPPGAPADQALWTAAQDVSSEVAEARAAANEHQWKVRQNRYDERLASLAKSAEPAVASRAAELLRNYREAIAHNHLSLTRQWPVDPTRGCRYTALSLGSVMTSPGGSAKEAQLRAARADVQECIARARPALEVMHASNASVERLVAEAEAVLPPLQVASVASPDAAPVCRGTLSGSVTGTFECVARIVADEDGDRFVFALEGKAPIPGLPSYAPGAFELPRRIEARTYTLETLGQGRASVAAVGGTLYVASKTSAIRGEVTLTLRTVTKDSSGAWVVHGTYRARLIPAGGGKTGEVQIEAGF